MVFHKKRTSQDENYFTTFYFFQLVFRWSYAWNSFFTSDDQPVQINNGARKFVYRFVDRRNHYHAHLIFPVTEMLWKLQAEAFQQLSNVLTAPFKQNLWMFLYLINYALLHGHTVWIIRHLWIINYYHIWPCINKYKTSVFIIIYSWLFMGSNMKCPNKYVKYIFFTWFHMHKILKCPKIGEFHFRFLFYFKIDHVLIFWNAPLSYVRKYWNASFFLFHSENGKNGVFQNFLT